MIEVKDHSVLTSMLIYPAHPKLAKIMEWLVKEFSHVVITCAYEDRDYPSVHSVVPFRGIDIRSHIYEDPQAVAEKLNEHWIYDPERPWKKCALYHDTGRGPHIHLQVHDRTIMKKE